MSRLFLDFAIRAYVAGIVVGIAAPVIGSFLVQRRFGAGRVIVEECLAGE